MTRVSDDFTAPDYEGDQTEFCYFMTQDGKAGMGTLFLSRLIPAPSSGQSMAFEGEEFEDWEFIVNEVKWTIRESGYVHLWVSLTGREM